MNQPQVHLHLRMVSIFVNPPPALLVLPHNHQLIHPTSINPTRILLQRRIHTKSRRWDSNAETFRTRNYDFNDFQDDDEEEEDTNQWLDILEDFIDGVWIFKCRYSDHLDGCFLQ